jgi:hypothetical protein
MCLEWHVARMRAGEKMHIGYSWKSQKWPLGRQGRRWVDNIKMNLGEIGWGGTKCIDLSQDREQWRTYVNTAMNLGVGKSLSSRVTAQLSMKLGRQEYENTCKMSEWNNTALQCTQQGLNTRAFTNRTTKTSGRTCRIFLLVYLSEYYVYLSKYLYFSTKSRF